MHSTVTLRQAMIDALAWQIELGADEAIGEVPIDRFALTATLARPAPPVVAAPVAPAAAAGPPPAAALATAARDLEALAQAMRDWTASPLRYGARNFVFADGLPGAHVMVIGEAPGGDEDRVGRPFVGRAGQLLDAMLAAIGLSRAATDPARAVYITNILPWRPPGNRTPSPDESALFLPFVLRHIELAAPRVIFALGNTPTQALLGTTTGIKRLRGEWARLPGRDLPLLPSFHPAYLLRQPEDKRMAWADLRRLRAVLDKGPP